MESREVLLAHLQTLNHSQRMAHMVQVGRGVSAIAAGLLREMERGSAYERRLALQACQGSRDGAHVLRSIADPSVHVSGLALKLTAIVCDDRQALAALYTTHPRARVALLIRLVSRGRRPVIDSYVDRAAAGGMTADLAQILPFGTRVCVSRHLKAFADLADTTAWSRLARHHPGLAAGAIAARATAAEQLDARLRAQATAVLTVLGDVLPDEALGLVRLLARHEPLQKLPLQALARRRPEDVAELLLATEGRAAVSFAPVAGRLDPARLRALLEHCPGTLSTPQTWLHRLPPAQRGELFEAFGGGWSRKGGVVDAAILALLPRDLREREARRHLALPALAVRPAERLPYASLLPWDEAVLALNPSVGSPDPELRAVAVAALIQTGRFHRNRLGDVLAFMLARKNEQDPVRMAAMGALSSLPPGRWQTEHLDALGQIIRQALDAADLSHATATAAEQLATKLLARHPEWSAQWIATLVRERGRVSLYGLQDRLTDADVRRAAPALLPVLESWETRERRPQLLAAAQALGRRLRAFDGLADVLENMLYERGDAWVAAQALAVLHQHCPERFRRLVPALLADDPSWATQPSVYDYLHRRAQDLLTPYLGRRAYAGRFSTGRTRFVLPIREGFFRWTPAQQSTFATTLEELTRDSVRDTPTVLAAVDQLSALPDVPPTRLLELAGAANKKLAVRDAALRVLGRLDGGRGVPALVEALQDDRARIAIYALRAALRMMPPAGAVALLRRVPMDKVTVAKEVARLLGEVGTAEAWQDLMAMADLGSSLHRDVRVALLRALWAFLDRPETWQRLQEAAIDADPEVAAGVVRVPADRLNDDGHRRLSALLATLLEHPDAKLRLDVLQRIQSLPVSDRERRLMPPLMQLMGTEIPDLSSAAAAAVFATYAGRQARPVGDAIAALLPSRRALRTAISALESRLLWDRAHLLPTARAVVEALAADPLAATLRAGLTMRALPPAEQQAVLEAMADSGDLHADALAAAVSATSAMGVWPGHKRWDLTAAALCDHRDERLRRIGLAALTAAARSGRGWDKSRRQTLAALQADLSPLVATAAQFTFPDHDDGAGEADETPENLDD